MVLSEDLHHRYNQYKSDTDVVANWLATIARQCGFKSPEDPSFSAGRTGARLKGKARKLAQAQAASADARAHEEELRGQEYLVAINDFVPLATFIAKSKDTSARIPKNIMAALDQAIKLRKQFEVLYNGLGTSPDSGRSDQGHSYFIGVLEHVAVLLRPELTATKERYSTFNAARQGAEDLLNRFELLTVEETQDQENTHEEIHRDLKPPTPTRFKADLSASKDEALMGSMAVWMEVHAIRSTVRKLWTAYRDGHLDLVATSLATNTAIGFIRQKQEDYQKSFATKISPICVSCICVHEHRDQFPQSQAHDEPYDLCGTNAHTILQYQVKDLIDDPSKYVPTVKNNFTELLELRPDRASMSPDEMKLEDFKVAAGVLPEYRALLEMDTRQPAEHELFQAMRELVLYKVVEFWHIIALQVYLDIRHVLRKDVTRGFQDLVQCSDRMINDIDQVLSLHESTQTAKAPSGDNNFLRETREMIARWTRDDFVATMKYRLYKNKADVQQLPKDYFLKRDPLWCGMLLYKFRVAAYEGAIFTINQYSSVLSNAHLYNALRQNGMLIQAWRGMDYILTKHVPEHIFVGDLPRKFDQCQTRLILAFGASPSAFARDPRRSSLRISSHKTRTLKMQTPVFNAFKGRYCDSNGHRHFAPDDIQDMLVRIAEKTLKQKISIRGSIQRSAELLAYLALVLHSECVEMTFNYFKLHMNCWKMLQQLDDSIGADVSAWMECERIPAALPYLAWFLLADAAEAERICARSGAKLDTFCPAIATAGKVMDALLADLDK
jgi:hypothetical protein